MEPGKSLYELDLDTLQTTETGLSVQLITSDASNNVIRFNLKLTPLIDNTLRLQIEEALPLRQRFFPPHVLVKDPTSSR